MLSNICNVQELPALATVKPCKKPSPLLIRFVALFVKLVNCIAYFFGIFTDLLDLCDCQTGESFSGLSS